MRRPLSFGSYSCALVVAGAGEASCGDGRLVLLPFDLPLPLRLSRPCEVSRDEGPSIRSLASAYRRSFSSRSIFALRCRSSKSASRFLRASSSLSSPSSSPSARFVASLLAMVGGFRLSTVTCGLGSCLSGTKPCASSQWLRLGFSADSHICFCSSWCCARRSALVGFGAVAGVGPFASGFCRTH